MNIWAERGSEKRGISFLRLFLFYVLPFFGGGCGKVGDVHTSAPPSHLPEEKGRQEGEDTHEEERKMTQAESVSRKINVSKASTCGSQPGSDPPKIENKSVYAVSALSGKHHLLWFRNLSNAPEIAIIPPPHPCTKKNEL